MRGPRDEGTREEPEVVARTGTAPQLVGFLTSGTSSVKELAVETIRKRFEDDADQSNRIAFVGAGAISPLVELVKVGTANAKIGRAHV